MRDDDIDKYDDEEEYGDGDVDVLSSSWGDDKIAWYENLLLGVGIIEIDFGEEIINGDDLSNYTLTRVGEGEISITEVGYENEGLVQLTLAEGLIGGENYRLDLDSAIEDISGNALVNNTSFDLNISFAFSLSSLDGSNGFVINGIDE